jgi:MerR family transcriptional regulator, light-induced transcriptional regulator
VDDLADHQAVPEYNTRAVEKLTGIPADTFRAWERRHGLPNPARTAGNHRLYSERDIAIVRMLKQMTDEGISISHAVAIVSRRLEPIVANDVPTENRPDQDCLGDLQERLITAFTRFSTNSANRTMEEALALFGPETVALDIVQPALIELGQRWERGEICVAMEHFATSWCMHKLSALYNASQPEHGRPTVIASCVEGELHEVGLMITAVVLSRAGFRVVYLGANMPGAELVEAVSRVEPDAVVLAAPTETSVVALRETIDTVRSSRIDGDDILIAYGGRVFEDAADLRDDIGALYLGADGRAARDLLLEALEPRFAVTA